MNRPLLYLKLIAALLAAASTFACSAILDTDGLSSEWEGKQDGRTDTRTDGPPPSDATGDSVTPDTFIPLDTGGCINGVSCTVIGKKGRCSIGTSVCADSGTGICSQKYSPTTETCNGLNTIHDQDCDGVKDNADSDAHASCGAGKYCAGTACKNGCWKTSQCTGNSDTCTNHVCRCGTHSACEGANPVCSSGVCRCDSDSTCKSKETCTTGVCNCGSTAGPAAGPFCTSGTCNPTTGQCDLPPTDAGPDQGPPPDQGVTPDQAPPTPDQSLPTPDQAVPTPDQAVPVDQAVPTQ